MFRRLPGAFRWLVAAGLLLTAPSLTIAQELTEYWLGAVRSKDGTLFIVDRLTPGVWQAKDGKLSLYFEGSKKFRTPLNAARCIAFDKDGHLLVGDTSTRDVYRFTEPGRPLPLTKGVKAGIGMPMAIAAAADGTIFVADTELHRIFKVPHEGGPAEEFAVVEAPRGLAFNNDGDLLVLSLRPPQIQKLSKDGKSTPLIADRPFNFPHNIVCDADGTLFVTDGYEKAVWKVGTDLKPVKLVSGPPLDNPVGLSLNPSADGPATLLVTDPRAHAVFELDRSGKLTKLELSR